jgi:hypothetical protein
VDEAQEHLLLLLLLEAGERNESGDRGAEKTIRIMCVCASSSCLMCFRHVRHQHERFVPADDMLQQLSLLQCWGNPDRISHPSWPPCFTKIFIRSPPSASGNCSCVNFARRGQKLPVIYSATCATFRPAAARKCGSKGWSAHAQGTGICPPHHHARS